MAESTASPLIFKRPGPNGETLVKLEGRSLPYRPLTFEGSLRVKRTDYVGNPVATIQVLGSKEDPFEFRGMWKDKFLGNGRAEELRDLFEAIRRGGTEMEIVWGGIVRRGFLVKAVFRHLRRQDIEYTLTWELYSQADEPTFVVNNFIQIASTQESEAEALKARLALAAASLQTVQGKTSALDRLLAGANALFDGIDAMQNSLTAGLFQANLSLDTARNLVTRARSVQLRAVDTVRLANDVVADVQFSGRGLISVLTFDLARREMEATALESTAYAIRTQNNVLAFTVPQIAAAVVLVVGQDLRIIAAKHLGNADAWETIADFNGLGGSVQPAGTLVLIPRI